MVSDQPELLVSSDLGADAVTLATIGHAEGYDFCGRLVDEWRSGANRFDRPGEVWLEAREGGVLVGFGGLNRDPYLDDPTVGRIRHLYVRADRRGAGIGAALVTALLARSGPFARVRLRAAEGAGGFYDRLGFAAADEPGASHTIDRDTIRRLRDASTAGAPYLPAVSPEDAP